jgi:(p)ppGpp synthase/HD superfamily hydrolase
MSKLSKAIKLAAEVHEGQVDKAGEPYILHALAVMRMVDTGGKFITPEDRESVMIVAVLHDAIEDFEGEPGELSRLKDYIYNEFGSRVFSALDALTHWSDEDYLESYIERVARDWIARRVKIADLTHNMDPRRLPAGDIGDKEYRRWAKYRKAIVRLERVD